MFRRQTDALHFIKDIVCKNIKIKKMEAVYISPSFDEIHFQKQWIQEAFEAWGEKHILEIQLDTGITKTLRCGGAEDILKKAFQVAVRELSRQLIERMNTEYQLWIEIKNQEQLCLLIKHSEEYNYTFKMVK